MIQRLGLSNFMGISIGNGAWDGQAASHNVEASLFEALLSSWRVHISILGSRAIPWKGKGSDRVRSELGFTSG